MAWERPFALAGMLALALAVPHRAEAPRVRWDAPAASRYMEQRQQTWLNFTARRAKASHNPELVACTSCHTGLPYLLARPALAATLGEPPDTPYTAALLGLIRLRLANSAASLYHKSEPVESRSFESVVAALALAADDHAHDRRQPDPATEAALDRMWRCQLESGDQKGSWPWSKVELEPWEATQSVYYGTSLAALAAGMAPGGYARRPELQGRIAAMASYLSAHFNQQMVHHRLAALWASRYLPAAVRPEDRAKALDEIWKHQNPDGGWSLRALGPWQPHPKWYNAAAAESGDSESYATAFTACALRQAGISPTSGGMRRALRWLAQHQQPSGAWSGRSLNQDRADPVTGYLMSDAATGYAVLALSAR